jgi:hypothetical protein
MTDSELKGWTSAKRSGSTKTRKAGTTWTGYTWNRRAGLQLKGLDLLRHKGWNYLDRTYLELKSWTSAGSTKTQRAGTTWNRTYLELKG